MWTVHENEVTLGSRSRVGVLGGVVAADETGSVGCCESRRSGRRCQGGSAFASRVSRCWSETVGHGGQRGSWVGGHAVSGTGLVEVARSAGCTGELGQTSKSARAWAAERLRSPMTLDSVTRLFYGHSNYRLQRTASALSWSASGLESTLRARRR